MLYMEFLIYKIEFSVVGQNIRLKSTSGLGLVLKEGQACAYSKA